MLIKSEMRVFQLLLLLSFMLVQFACNKPPNVILIMADDMGAECLNAYGGTSYHTPNLDLMARQGLLVTGCISQPLCTPSRVKLMTGLSNSRNYEYFGYLNTLNPTFGNIMKEAGYKTCISGKWQLNGLSYPEQISDWNDAGRPHQMGFDEYCLWQLTAPRKQGERYANPLIETNGEFMERDKQAYGPDVFCNFVLDFIEKNKHQPFFAYYPMVLVHDPFVPTPDSDHWEVEDKRYKQDTAYFGEMMTYADKVVGRIIKKLEDTRLRDNTIVIFTADNGTSRRIISSTRNRRINGAKGMTITDGVHVPLLINWPKKIKSGSLYDGLIEFSDFFPTLAELVDRNVKSDGHSFLPLLTGKGYAPRETVSVHYDPRWSESVNRYRNSFVQTMSHKLYQDGSFFDLQRDILETDPLSASSLSEGDRLQYDQLHRKMKRVPDTPPNLILIISDDQGYGDLSLHGNSLLETPHLDSLGLKGARLDNFHVSPVCAPTRAAVLTGRRPMSTGTYYVTRGGEVMDSEEYTIAEVLQDNGYSTGYFGKWHNGSHHPHHPLDQGFDEFLGFTAGHWNNYFDPVLEENGRMVKTRGYIADIFTDRAIDFIAKRQDEPFFCYLAYNTPHAPFQVPDQYFNMYKDRVEDQDSSLRIMNAAVYGMVKNIDDNVGRLMDTLQCLNLNEKTIVLFMTDNGPNTDRFNDQMKGRKAWVNDGGVRVPCFIKWNNHIPENKVIHSTTAHIDLFPTLISLMGVNFSPKKEIHGIDLSPRIYGVDTEEDRLLFTHVNHGVEVESTPGAVRTADWRLTFRKDDQLELTSRSDHGELNNLSGKFPYVADSLKRLYDEWFTPLKKIQIPPIPVGVVDSVVIPGHEGFLTGNAHYNRSQDGWSNDWVTGLDGDHSSVFWRLNIAETSDYDCIVKYASPSDSTRIFVIISGQTLERLVTRFIPVREKSFNRTVRPNEAYNQTWSRISIGHVHLVDGPGKITIKGNNDDLEIHSVILTKN